MTMAENPAIRGRRSRMSAGFAGSDTTKLAKGKIFPIASPMSRARNASRKRKRRTIRQVIAPGEGDWIESQSVPGWSLRLLPNRQAEAIGDQRLERTRPRLHGNSKQQPGRLRSSLQTRFEL